jgi:hypothetical protein
MKRTLVVAVILGVSAIGMGQAGGSQEQPAMHVAVAGEKLDSGLGNMVYGESLDSGAGTMVYGESQDSGLGEIGRDDWKRYVN